jgi:hypothetical protein
MLLGEANRKAPARAEHLPAPGPPRVELISVNITRNSSMFLVGRTQ